MAGNVLIKRWVVYALAAAMMIALSSAAGGGNFARAAETATIRTDADVAGELGLLIGDGNGLTAEYLAKPATRLQAALISLRLTGALDEATAFEGAANFADKHLVNAQNQAALAYLKAHPELGWQGGGDGTFDPLGAISSQQFYKVVLETLGYRSGVDFAYEDTEAFAKSKGLAQIAGNDRLTNAHIATALVEALSARTSGGATLLAELQRRSVIDAGASLPQGGRLLLAHDDKLGAYLTDGDGKSLYFFTKDAENPNACQGNCLTNWPVFYADELHVPAALRADDFGVHVRTDGAKQLTYKGWPLYYFAKDAAAGDVNGDGANGVWFAAKADYGLMIGTSSALGSYLTDDRGRTLYYFDKDMPNTSLCEGNCIANWPAYVPEGGALPSTLEAADLTVIARADGSMQAAYKGYPLYYFVKDAARGDTTGQGVNDVWFVVDPGTFAGTTAGAAKPAEPAEPAAPSEPADAASGKTYAVDIREYSFGSEPLLVEAGSRIVFTNFDEVEHNAVAVNGAFSTPLLKQGETYEVTLTEPGTYEYVCEPHRRFMTGTIIVK